MHLPFFTFNCVFYQTGYRKWKGSACESLNFVIFDSGYVSAHTLPVVYEKYEDEIDDFIYKLLGQFQSQYQKLDGSLLSKIPKGTRKMKKSDWCHVILCCASDDWSDAMLCLYKSDLDSSHLYWKLNFNSVWLISEPNSNYPYLRFMLHDLPAKQFMLNSCRFVGESSGKVRDDWQKALDFIDDTIKPDKLMKSEYIFRKQSKKPLNTESMGTKIFCLVLLIIFVLCSDLLCISGRPLHEWEFSASEIASPSLPKSGLKTKTSSASLVPNRRILPPLPEEVNSSGKWLPMPNLIPSLPVPSPSTIPSNGMPGFPLVLPPLLGWGSNPNPSQPRLPIGVTKTANVKPWIMLSVSNLQLLASYVLCSSFYFYVC